MEGEISAAIAEHSRSEGRNLEIYTGNDYNNDRLFTSREYDREIDLYYYRARYYDAELWRFISRDPIGIADDVNLYGYVGGNPVNGADPLGLQAYYKQRDDGTICWDWNQNLPTPLDAYNFALWVVEGIKWWMHSVNEALNTSINWYGELYDYAVNGDHSYIPQALSLSANELYNKLSNITLSAVKWWTSFGICKAKQLVKEFNNLSFSEKVYLVGQLWGNLFTARWAWKVMEFLNNPASTVGKIMSRKSNGTVMLKGWVSIWEDTQNAAQVLPKFKWKSTDEIRQILKERGFKLKPRWEDAESVLEKREHCDGSACRLDIKDTLWQDPHAHKLESLKKDAQHYDDYGNPVNNKSGPAHISITLSPWDL